MAKRRKQLPQRKLGKLLIITGLLFLTYWGAHTYFRYQSLTLEASQTQSAAVGSGSRPVRVTIPNKFDLDVAEAVEVSGKWGAWSDKATFLPISAKPGEAGNIVIYGHNKKLVMGKLIEVKAGDEITVLTADGQVHKYQVEDTQSVDTTHTELLNPTSYEVLTLYTCTGFLDRLRWVVRARPIKV
ncbi:MAG: sortase [bacterium]|nr:sortase [bacterium]